MATQYSPLLKLALPVTGELSGTWGDVVNANITSMIEQAVAGLATINTWTANSHTLTTANGTTSESRCAMLVAADGAGGTVLTGAGEIICPATSKLYVVRNGSSYTVTLKTSAGTGIAVPTGQTTFLFCDGTNVNACVTTIVNGVISGNLTVNGNTTLGDANTDTVTVNARFNTDLVPSTDNARDLGSAANSWKDLYVDGTIFGSTIDLTNLEVTNIKAKDGTAGMQIADSTGVVTISQAPVMTALTASQAVFTTSGKALVSNAITGTGNVVMSASPTLTGTIDAAAATLSGNLTLSGGTANGVAYLNGSKVLTSGSALTFDGTTLGVTSGGSTPALRLFGASTSQGQLQFGSTNGYLIQGGADYLGINFNTNNATRYSISDTGISVWSVAGSEQMRLTSTGLGIGTSSPGTKLDVRGAGRFVGSGTPSSGPYGGQVDIYTDSNAVFNGIWVRNDSSGSSANAGIVLNAAGNSWRMAIGSSANNNNSLFWAVDAGSPTTLMNLTTSGNLGLGVTPSAWSGTNIRSLDISLWTSLANGDAFGSALTFNGFYNGTSWIYKQNNNAAKYETDGGHRWYTAPSGTAGDAITFTQAMTLDASGNLLVGTTSNTNTARIKLAWTTGNYGIESIASANTLSYHMVFGNASNPDAGNISTTNNTTTYATSSDYRLKNVTGPITTSGTYIDSLKPVEGTWKSNGSPFVGLIAHEVQEVSRTQVATGVKDGEQMQGMDYSSSEIIANLIAEVQSLRARIAALESK